MHCSYAAIAHPVHQAVNDLLRLVRSRIAFALTLDAAAREITGSSGQNTKNGVPSKAQVVEEAIQKVARQALSKARKAVSTLRSMHWSARVSQGEVWQHGKGFKADLSNVGSECCNRTF